MKRALLFAAMLAACAASPVRRGPVLRHAEDGWLEHLGALILLISSPNEYLTVRNAFPFQLHITLLERSRRTTRFEDAFWPIGRESAGETNWVGELPLTVFLNTERFVESGYIGIRPVGLTRVPNPLRETCPRDLVRAATADMDGSHLLILEARPPLRDRLYGCVYGFHYLIEGPAS